jgi:hypothetical protein
MDEFHGYSEKIKMTGSNKPNKPIGLFTTVSWTLGIISIFVLIIVSANVAWKVLFLAPLCSSVGIIFGGIALLKSTRKLLAIGGMLICFLGLFLELGVWLVASVRMY